MCSWSSCSVHVTVVTPLAIISDILNQKWDEVQKIALILMKTTMVTLLLLLLLTMMIQKKRLY